MIKRLTAFLLAVMLLISCVACQGSKADETERNEEPSSTTTTTAVAVDDNNDDHASSDDRTEASGAITPLLYKVSDGEGRVIWLFGSVHIGVEDMYPLPDYVMDAYHGADALAVEYDIIASSEDMSGAMALMQKMVYQDGTTIADHLSKEVYEAAVAILVENNAYVSYYDYFIPVMWMSLIENLLVNKLGYDSELGIDYHLLTAAKESGKTILEVESEEFQINMLTTFSPDLQEILLQNSIYTYGDPLAAEDYRKLMDIWCNGNEAEFAALLVDDDVEFANDEEKALYEEYNNAMIVERNLSMTDYAENALKSGREVFMCVGAAHIVGEDAVADLLAERGYTVEIVR